MSSLEVCRKCCKAILFAGAGTSNREVATAGSFLGAAE